MNRIAMTDASTGQITGSMIVNETLEIGQTFRLIGRTIVFKAVELPVIAGFIPTVVGVSLDGTLRTQARIVDTACAKVAPA